MMYSYFSIQSSNIAKSSIISSCFSLIVIFIFSAKQACCFLHTLYQDIYFFFRILKCERRTNGTWYSKNLHQWFCAMMSGPDGNTLLVENFSHIKWMKI